MIYTGNTTTGTFTATSATAPAKSGTSANVTISAPLDHFLVEAAAGGSIGTQTAGVPFSVKVTAQDASNNTVTGFNGTVDVTSNRTCSSGCATTAAFTAGVLSSTSVTLTQAGTLSTITATDHGGTGKTGTSQHVYRQRRGRHGHEVRELLDRRATCSLSRSAVSNDTDTDLQHADSGPVRESCSANDDDHDHLREFRSDLQHHRRLAGDDFDGSATSGLVTLHHGSNGGTDTAPRRRALASQPRR